MKNIRLYACALAVVALLAAGCSRSSDSTEAATNSGSTSSSSSQDAATRLSSGGFGDIDKVCEPGDAKGATDKGVSDTEIHIGTVTDKGATVAPGTNKEMYDAAVAFTKWCNEKGGILGRKLVLDDLDAALFNYGQVITAACDGDFALVGGGAAFDDDNGQREGCGLPNIPGFVVSTKARAAGLQVQPVPNPVYRYMAGPYFAADAVVPGGMQAYGSLAPNLPDLQTLRDQAKEAVSIAGFSTVYAADFNLLGESNWTPFIDEMRNKGVKVLEFIGEPTFLVQMQKAMSTAGWYPDITIENSNMYDQKYAAEGGATAKNTYVQLAFTPFELADENPATADYLELMKQYNPGGKVALLGAQAVSAYLLFAKAATDCGSNLTRQCLLEKAKVSSWTGGGLHAETNPGAGEASGCFLMMKVTPDGFVYDEAATRPTKDKFNCDPKNEVELKNDYGVARASN